METLEVAKVYMSCIKNNIQVTEGFKRDMESFLLVKHLPGCDAASLPYLLPLF